LGLGFRLIVEEQVLDAGAYSEMRRTSKPPLSPNRFQALAASVSTFALPEDRA